MRKWEYTTVECLVNGEGPIGTAPNWYLDTLNRMGQEGWELVTSMIFISQGYSNRLVATLKREVVRA
jgi:hypothetical protein